MRASVVIATRGRPDSVTQLVSHLNRQSIQPERVVLVSPSREDLGAAPDQHDRTIITLGGDGLAHQRNLGLRAMEGCEDIVIFFDDDFVPSDYWVERACKIFDAHPTIVGLTGRVLADGINSAGIDFSSGFDLVRAADAAAEREYDGNVCSYKSQTPYGCNMAFRLRAIEGMYFDERLVLYGWQEDFDFGTRARARGRVVLTNELWGVHLGVKSGRVSGVRLGYSQIVNPWYLVRKGTMRAGNASRMIARNVAKNLVRSLWSEPHVDRRGRFRGNLLGFADLICGRSRPERAADF